MSDEPRGRFGEGKWPVRVVGGTPINAPEPHQNPRLPDGWEYREECTACIFCAVERAARALDAARRAA